MEKMLMGGFVQKHFAKLIGCLALAGLAENSSSNKYMKNIGTVLKIGLWLVLVSSSALCRERDPDKNLDEDIVCTFGSDVREVRVDVYNSPVSEDENVLSCRSTYSRAKLTTVLWSSQKSGEACTPRAHEIVKKLKAAQFSCLTMVKEGWPVDENGRRITLWPTGFNSKGSDFAKLNQDQQKVVLLHMRARIKQLTKKIGDTSHVTFSSEPDEIVVTDADGDGRQDIIFLWGYSSYRCQMTYLTIAIRSAVEDEDEVGGVANWEPYDVELPSACGPQGWHVSFKGVDSRGTTHIHLQDASPLQPDHFEEITVKVSHLGHFEFHDSAGHFRTLESIDDPDNF